MNRTSEIGQWGENIVADHLRAEGFMILERNWRSGRYELDIIALRDECIHFVEVKTRSASDWSTGEESIVVSKRRALGRAASAYLAQTGSQREFQFDLAVVEFLPGGSHEIRYTESILESHW